MSRQVYCSSKCVYIISLILVLGLAAGGANAGIRSGLVGYYPLDEGSGNVAHDMSGQNHNGTLHNGITWISPGYLGGGVNVDGITDTRIELGTWNPAEGTGQLSLAVWIRWSGGNNTYQGLIGKRNTWPDTTMFQFQVRPESGGTFRLETGSVAIVSPNNTLSPLVQTWVHVAATFDGTMARLYLNGQEVASGAFAFYAAGEASIMGIGCVTGGGAGYSGNGEVFQGDMDEVCIYNRALSVEELSLVMTGIGSDTASNPRPADEATDVPRDVVLSWDPMETATTRDVYFGTVYDDVNDASRANPMGVLLSQGQTATSYDPPDLLDFGMTYYWRIDEVNAPPDETIFKGEVWSFTTEPLAYPIANIIATSNAVSEPDAGPEKTVDGSGLDANDQHSTTNTDMWAGSTDGVERVWIQFEFDRVYKLHEFHIWNYNVIFEPVIGFGFKDVTIEHSEDGTDWTVFGDVQFAQATARTNYTYSTTVDLSNIVAKFVRLTANSTWGAITNQCGLSEVRFLYIPVWPREPQPADGATGIDPTITMSWRPGREAVSHEVYLGTDPNILPPVDAVSEASYTPAALKFGQTYYWQIAEVNDAEEASVWASDLWSFTTQEYALIDGFEHYTDDVESGEAIFDTWLDGWVNDTGSTVGHLETPFAERTIVYGGRQSMPLQYDNTDSPFYSEAEREFEAAQNWTDNAADTLRLFIAGQAPAFLETTDGRFLMNAIGTDIWDTADEFRYAYKSLSGNGSITVRVDSLIHTNEWAKAGVMIRESLHPGSKHTFVCLTPDYGVSFQQRPETGNVMSQESTDVVVASSWVKLTRTGNVFTAQESADGITWGDVTFQAPVDIPMAGDVLIGLAVTSHNTSIATAAEFSNLSTTGNVTGQWEIAEIGTAQPKGNSAEPIYIRIEDSAGATATVVNADELITLRSAWQEWLIPYSDLSGVNMSRVQKMAIGVGSKTSPSAGGTGTVYIDDIGFGRPVVAE